jgi:integrase
MKNFPEQGRKRFLTLAEAPRFAQAMLAYGRDSDTRWRFTALMTLLLLTGCRLSEILQARWEWVNWEEKRIDWPDTKTGADEAHLAPPVLELLRELQRRVPGNPFIIAGAHIGKPLGGHNNMWRAVCVAAGIKNLRIHDLRKSFASIALADGVGIDVIAGLLRHSNPAITAERYAFLMDEERKAAADKVATAVTRRLRLVE